MKIETNDNTLYCLLCFVAIVFILCSLSFSTTLSNEKVQLDLASKGFSPIEISCAYNINSELCKDFIKGYDYGNSSYTKK